MTLRREDWGGGGGGGTGGRTIMQLKCIRSYYRILVVGGVLSVTLW